jgi:hypothetical protein
MKSNDDSFFWLSYSDLITSLFFVVLVLFTLTYVQLKRNEAGLELEKGELKVEKEELEKKLKVYDLVEQNLKPLKDDKAFFKYETQYKRFTLSFDVQFKEAEFKITPEDIQGDFKEVSGNIQNAGLHLIGIIDTIVANQKTNPELENVSYLLILAGYASKLPDDKEFEEYKRSYLRAWHLWNHWKTRGIDFEADKYSDLIDLQIAGNGWGGIGRYDFSSANDYESERMNQRFIIQIVPKIANEIP